MTDFPADASAFYTELEFDNSREFWAANRHRYDRDVRAPLQAVTAALEAEFGTAKLFRPHRDVRFSSDKSPYKTHQGCYVESATACGFYVEVNAQTVIAGGGFYAASGPALARVRAAVADDDSGGRLEAIVADLRGDGWTVEGDRLKTTPRGYPADHPRIDLLRHKTLFTMREVLAEGEADVAREVAEHWRRVAALVDWCASRLDD